MRRKCKCLEDVFFLLFFFLLPQHQIVWNKLKGQSVKDQFIKVKKWVCGCDGEDR